MSNKLEEINIHSEEVQDLLGKVPSWITRNGIILIVVLLFMLFAGSWFFKYPDIITAPVVVSSENVEGTVALIGKIQLRGYGVQKVKAGQRVNLKFTNYPYLEFGLVKGEVSRISMVPTRDYYSLEVKLPDQLVSSYGKKFVFQQELSGTAEIVTENQSLLNRILHPARAIFGEKFEK